MFRKNKKGFAQDILFFGIIIFIMAIIIIVGGKLRTDLNAHYQSTDMDTDSKKLMEDSSTRYSNVFGWIFFSIFMLFTLAIFMTVFMLPTHPAFFFVSIIILGISLLVLGIISNAYEKFAETPSMSAEATQLAGMTPIWDNWIMIMLVIGIISVVLLYAKLKN